MTNLTARQSEVVDLITSEGLSVPETAERLGCSNANVYKILAREDVQVELVARSRSALAGITPAAVRTVADLASSAKSEYVRLQSALAVLDRVGINEPSQGNTLAIQINLEPKS